MMQRSAYVPPSLNYLPPRSYQLKPQTRTHQCVPMLTARQNAPIPAGRSIISCKKLLVRLKEKHKDDIVKIKNGQAFGAPTAAANTDATPEKPKAKATPKKRKSKLDLDAGEDGGEADGSPKKKATPRGRKKKVEVKEEVKEEEGLVEEEMLEEEA